MKLTRRDLLTSIAAAPLAFTPQLREAQAAQAALRSGSGTKLVILGSGAGPNPTVPNRTRHMTSHVMLSNDRAYVLDCGLGVTNQFARTGIPFSAVRSIFITHHHPDHNIEYGPFLLLGWIQGFPLSVQAFGPPPLAQMTRYFLRAYKATIDFWVEDLKVKPLVPPRVKEVSAPGAVTEDDRVRVTATLVQHPPVRPALAYRFDFPDRSIAFSGDTTPLDSVATLAKGASVLVHEALYVPALEAYVRSRIAAGVPIRFEDYMAHMKIDHSPVEEVGRVAQQAGVKTLVLSHLTPGIDGIPDTDWRGQAAKHFTGEIIVARDLMVL